MTGQDTLTVSPATNNGYALRDSEAPASSPAQPSEKRYRIALGRVTSVVIVTNRRTRVYTGTLDELSKTYRQVTVANLLTGWWGIPFGLVWTPIWLYKNHQAMAQLKSRAGGA